MPCNKTRTLAPSASYPPARIHPHLSAKNYDKILTHILPSDNKVVHSHKISIMAITIKNIQVLEGAAAEDFVRSADENAVKATPRLSASARKRLQKVLEKSRSFRFN